MSIIKKILAEILVVFISFIVSVLGVSFFYVITKPDISIAQRALISNTILFIMVSAAQPAIWKKGFITKGDRVFSFILSSIFGVFVYLALDILAANLFWSTQFALGLLLGALANLIGVFAGSIFCNYHLAKTGRKNEKVEKEEEILRSKTIKGKCPDCGLEYTNFDYREDTKDWFCSQCNAKLPRI